MRNSGFAVGSARGLHSFEELLSVLRLQARGGWRCSVGYDGEGSKAPSDERRFITNCDNSSKLCIPIVGEVALGECAGSNIVLKRLIRTSLKILL